MKTKSWIITALAAAVGVAALAWVFAPRPLAVEAATVVQQHFEAVIDEEGKTLLSERFVVAAPLAGQLRRITLKEGDTVQAGAALATLVPVLPAMLDERTRLELQARVQMAQAGVQRAATRIAGAEVALEGAQLDVQRTEPLALQGFMAPTRLDLDRLAVRAAQQELAAARAERQMAAHELEMARAALGLLRTPRHDGPAQWVLRAPVAGQVLRVLQTSEGTVAIGTPLLELGDTAQLEVVAELLSSDALAAQPGSRVVIDRWGGAHSLEGRVQRIEPAAYTKVSALGVEEQRVRVHIAITSAREQWQRLGDAYRVGVRIVVLEREQALQVPASAVFPLPLAQQPQAAAVAAGTAAQAEAADNGRVPQHAVFTIEEGKARRVAVEVLARNASMAWIRDGLAPGTAVVVYPPNTLRDGQRVELRTP